MYVKNNSKQASSILIVDDHPAMRSTMLDILEDEDFYVTTTCSGEEAIQLCSKNFFDLVLMDMQMPTMTGVEAFRRIKEINLNSPRFIFMSAYSVEELKEECFRMGAMAFLQKPLDMDEVIHLIRNRSSPSVLIYLKEAKAKKAALEALEESGFKVVSVESPDEVLINARQISHNFVVVEREIVDSKEISLEMMLDQASPLSQLVKASSTDDPALLLKEISRLRLQQVHQKSGSGGWFIDGEI